jgi:hypothetical protein
MITKLLTGLATLVLAGTLTTAEAQAGADTAQRTTGVSVVSHQTNAPELAAASQTQGGPRPGEEVWQDNFHSRETCLRSREWLLANIHYVATARCSTAPEHNGRYWLFYTTTCVDLVTGRPGLGVTVARVTTTRS